VSLPAAAWWEVRPAANRKPATYRCPICDRHLASLSEHMLLFPEGDHSLRRHAHTACVMRARAAGRLPLKEDWQAAQPRKPRFWDRLRRER
jgi:hypothetical protein